MCDYDLGLFAWRYGYAKLGAVRAIADLELREAVRSNKPRLRPTASSPAASSGNCQRRP